MKICASCGEGLSKDGFSKRQWSMKQHERRCKTCIVNKRAVQLKAPQKHGGAPAESREPECAIERNEGASCWICLGGEDEGELVRDCSCRGDDSGFSHISCLVELAKQQSRQWHENDEEKNINDFRRPWEYCACCHQKHNNALSIELAMAFVAFVQDTYEGDTVKLLESLVFKLEAFQNSANSLEPAQRNEAKQTTAHLLFLARHATVGNDFPEKRIRLMEAVAYYSLGRVVLAENTSESINAAVVCFEQCRDVSQEVGLSNYVSLAEMSLHNAKSKCEAGPGKAMCEEVMLAKVEEIYQLYCEDYGDEHLVTMQAGVDLARRLLLASRFLEAGRLSTKFAPLCRRILGPSHSITKKAESTLGASSRRVVGFKVEGEWANYDALGYEKGGKQCVLQGPIMEPRKIAEEETFTVPSEDLQLTVDTPAICHGLERNAHLNGKVAEVETWDEDAGRYRLCFEDKSLRPCFVEKAYVRILFELPDE